MYAAESGYFACHLFFASTHFLEEDHVVLFLEQHVSDHGVPLRAVLAQVTHPPDKQKHEPNVNYELTNTTQGVCVCVCVRAH